MLCNLAVKAGIKDYTQLATDPAAKRPVIFGLDHKSAWTDGRTPQHATARHTTRHTAEGTATGGKERRGPTET